MKFLLRAWIWCFNWGVQVQHQLGTSVAVVWGGAVSQRLEHSVLWITWYSNIKWCQHRSQLCLSYSNVKFPSLLQDRWEYLKKTVSILSTWLHHLVGFYLHLISPFLINKTTPQSFNILVVVNCGFFIGNYDYFKTTINQKFPFFFFGRLFLFLSLLMIPSSSPSTKFHGAFVLEPPPPPMPSG